MNDCLKDIRLLEEFLNENISTKALSADDHVVLGMKYVICRSMSLSVVKRGDYQNCSVLYCVLKLCTVISALR